MAVLKLKRDLFLNGRRFRANNGRGTEVPAEFIPLIPESALVGHADAAKRQKTEINAGQYTPAAPVIPPAPEPVPEQLSLLTEDEDDDPKPVVPAKTKK